ncbi:MAG: glycosyltransferase family 2 protein [Candidatus Omnitrophica bacterium]|nr:glycosyltransferase family 2 protein [Candidatus Omnitrophota bacterium]
MSIVAPVHNEEKNIEKLYLKLLDVLSKTNRSFEIIFVDDGSTDHSLTLMTQLKQKHKKMKIVKLKKSFGQTAALSAGIDHAHGDVIILMDADLQHDPADIPKFLQKIDQGHDIVSGWRKERVDPFLRRKLPSLVANWMMSKISGIKIHDFGTTFKAYRKEIIKNVRLYGQFHRFIPVLAEGQYASIVEIPIASGKRGGGKSSYTLSRTFTVFFDLIRINFLSRFLSRPLQFFGSFGIGIGFIGFCIVSYLIYLKYAHGLALLAYRAPLFLLSVLLMLVGTQFLTLGLLGEIVVKVYYDNPNTKVYAVEEIIE